jgi:hypothetical protein
MDKSIFYSPKSRIKKGIDRMVIEKIGTAKAGKQDETKHPAAMIQSKEEILSNMNAAPGHKISLEKMAWRH